MNDQQWIVAAAWIPALAAWVVVDRHGKMRPIWRRLRFRFYLWRVTRRGRT
jgi:hypothetical protein